MRTHNMITVKHTGQWGIINISTSEFIGFQLNKGVKKIWTEKHYASSAFKLHTGVSIKDQSKYMIVRL